MANQAAEKPPQSKGRRKWGKGIAGGLGVAASIATIITFINSSSSSSSSSTTPVSQNGDVVVTSTAPPTTSPAASQGSVPSADLGTWGGFLDSGGLEQRFILNLAQGSPGGNVGSFNNQTENCQGTVFLNGVTTVTLNGASVPAADLDLETTQNPGNACVSSAEAYVASPNGGALVLEIVTAGTTQGSFQDPLAVANLSH
jgi:hypothetical protein